jgi:cytoplasmic iron level regulating protein YaaA (DUF328/UPF0246 family)
MAKIIALLSPAKSLDFESKPSPSELKLTPTEPSFLEKTERINKTLLNFSREDLSDLMNISEKLSELNFSRNIERANSPESFPKRRAAFAFTGDVYQGLEIKDLNATELNSLNKRVRILSGLYGMLKPSDLIHAYRLEMGTRMPIESSKNLYEFWQKEVTEELKDQLGSNGVLINLASKEYFSVLDKKVIPNQIIEIQFKEFKNNKYKVIALFAKKARGMMAQFIAKNEIDQVEDLKRFKMGNYTFNQKLSANTTFVFTR